MSVIKTTALMMLLAATAASSVAFAQHGHGHRGPRVGVYIGGPLWWGHPYYHAPSYYYVPTPIVQPSPVYIEQAPAPAVSAPAPAYWYYCRESQGYYPYVKDCPAAWERVAPQPSR